MKQISLILVFAYFFTPILSAAPEDASPKDKILRLIPVGAVYLPKYRDLGAFKLPEEIKAKSGEYMPKNLYVRNDAEENKYQKIKLRANTLSNQIKIRNKNSVVLYQLRETKSSTGEPVYQYDHYITANISPESTHILLVLSKGLKKEGWKNPRRETFDVSPNIFPENTCFVFNSSPFKVVVDIKGLEPQLVQPLEHKFLRGLKLNEHKSIPYKVGMKVGKKIERVTANAFKQKGGSRYYIFTYVDPKKGLRKHSKIAVSTETKPIHPEPKNIQQRP